MKYILGTLLMVVSVGILTFVIFEVVKANYQWTNDYKSYWNLADKASTIAQKSEYIDKFVGALEQRGLQGTNNAIVWKTQDNSFDQNFKALQSLQSRLHEIKTMDESSFAYQTAIQQITAQEQGQADEMLSVLSGCWWKVHYYYLWNAFFAIGIILGGILLFISSLVCFAWESY